MPKAQELLLIDGRLFETHKGTWRARVVNNPAPVDAEWVCYVVEFRLVEKAGSARNLKLRVMNAGPSVDADQYQSRIFDSLRKWLATDSADGKLSVGIRTGSRHHPATPPPLSEDID